MGDDHAAYVMGAYGNSLARTPNLDRLAREGVRFEHAYCNSPVCTPSRQSIITGKLPQSIGVTLLNTPLSEDQLTIAEHLKTFGYRTGAIGKMHFNSNLRHGFDYRIDLPDYQSYLKDHPPRAVPAGIQVKPPWKPFRDPARIWLNADYLPYGRYNEDMAGTFFARRAVDFLKRNSGEPFCLWVSFYEPHSPFDFPIEYSGIYQPTRMPVGRVGKDDPEQIPEVFHDLSHEQKQGIVAAYYTSVAFHDKNVGLVLDALRDLGLDKDTLVVYVGDHGYNLGHHGRFEKHSFFETAVRAPLLMRYPSRFERGRVINALVEFIDLMPTILDVCAVNHPQGLQGQSLLPLLSGRTHKGRDYVFSEYLFNWEEAMIRTRDWKLIYTKGGMARGDGYKTARPVAGRVKRLYDMRRDPEELNNLARHPEFKEIVNSLEEKLYQRLVGLQSPSWKAPTELSREELIDLLLVAPEGHKGGG